MTELGTAARSYAGDDTVAFLQSGDPKYTAAAFPGSFFTGFNANAAAILDKNGTVLWGRGFDLEEPTDDRPARRARPAT